VLNNKLVFTCFDGNEASICSYNPMSDELRTILKTGAAEITHMYVVNDAHIDYLADNAVYRYDVGSGDVEKLIAPADVFSFVPTYGGNIYAAGSAASASLFFESTELLDKVTYYSVEENSLIVTADSVSYKLDLTDLIDYCSNAKAERDLCSIMTPYDFYGVLPVSDILSLDGHDCEHCEEEAKTAPAFRTDAPDMEETRDNPEGLPIQPNVRQQQIINLARPVVDFSWTPEVSFDEYTSDAVTNQPNSYFASVLSFGLPYSRPGKFKTDRLSNGDPRYHHSYVFFGSIATLSACKAQMETSGTEFNLAAERYRGKGYGALYGLDCSAYVCYAWGYSSEHGSAGFNTDTSCAQITNTPWGGKLTQADLNKLLPGDAFVLYGSHAILVTEVRKNSNGNVVAVTTMEETPPSAIKTTYARIGGDFSLNYLLDQKLLPRKNDNGSFTWPYQVYRLNAAMTKVTLNAKPGIVSPNTIKVAVGLKYGYFNNNTLPTPTRSGYTFKGWYTASSGGTKVTSSTIVQNGNNHTLYAQWIKNGTTTGAPPIAPLLPSKTIANNKGEAF